MQRHFFTFLLTCFLVIGCSRQYVITPNSYYSPRKDKFKFKNTFSLIDSSVLSTNAIYRQNTYSDEVWLKFYTDGRLFYGSLSKVPKFPGDSVDGYTGYYKLNGNKIKAEIYYIQQSVWDYLVLEGEIKEDTIRFYQDHYRGAHRNIKHFTNLSMYEERYFIKTYEPVYLKEPDW